jgi:hypothetical protein
MAMADRAIPSKGIMMVFIYALLNKNKSAKESHGYLKKASLNHPSVLLFMTGNSRNPVPAGWGTMAYLEPGGI